MTPRTCELDGCDEIHYGRGFCRKHWARFRRSGDLEPQRHTHRTRVTPWRFV